MNDAITDENTGVYYPWLCSWLCCGGFFSTITHSVWNTSYNFGLILAAIAISLSILIFAKRLIAAAEKEKF